MSESPRKKMAGLPKEGKQSRTYKTGPKPGKTNDGLGKHCKPSTNSTSKRNKNGTEEVELNTTDDSLENSKQSKTTNKIKNVKVGPRKNKVDGKSEVVSKCETLKSPGRKSLGVARKVDRIKDIEKPSSKSKGKGKAVSSPVRRLSVQVEQCRVMKRRSCHTVSKVVQEDEKHVDGVPGEMEIEASRHSNDDNKLNHKTSYSKSSQRKKISSSQKTSVHKENDDSSSLEVLGSEGLIDLTQESDSEEEPFKKSRKLVKHKKKSAKVSEKKQTKARSKMSKKVTFVKFDKNESENHGNQTRDDESTESKCKKEVSKTNNCNLESEQISGTETRGTSFLELFNQKRLQNIKDHGKTSSSQEHWNKKMSVMPALSKMNVNEKINKYRSKFVTPSRNANAVIVDTSNTNNSECFSVFETKTSDTDTSESSKQLNASMSGSISQQSSLSVNDDDNTESSDEDRLVIISDADSEDIPDTEIADKHSAVDSDIPSEVDSDDQLSADNEKESDSESENDSSITEGFVEDLEDSDESVEIRNEAEQSFESGRTNCSSVSRESTLSTELEKRLKKECLNSPLRVVVCKAMNIDTNIPESKNLEAPERKMGSPLTNAECETEYEKHTEIKSVTSCEGSDTDTVSPLESYTESCSEPSNEVNCPEGQMMETGKIIELENQVVETGSRNDKTCNDKVKSAEMNEINSTVNVNNTYQKGDTELEKDSVISIKGEVDMHTTAEGKLNEMNPGDLLDELETISQDICSMSQESSCERNFDNASDDILDELFENSQMKSNLPENCQFEDSKGNVIKVEMNVTKKAKNSVENKTVKEVTRHRKRNNSGLSRSVSRESSMRDEVDGEQDVLDNLLDLGVESVIHGANKSQNWQGHATMAESPTIYTAIPIGVKEKMSVQNNSTRSGKSGIISGTSDRKSTKALNMVKIGLGINVDSDSNDENETEANVVFNPLMKHLQDTDPIKKCVEYVSKIPQASNSLPPDLDSVEKLNFSSDSTNQSNLERNDGLISLKAETMNYSQTGALPNTCAANRNVLQECAVEPAINGTERARKADGVFRYLSGSDSGIDSWDHTSGQFNKVVEQEVSNKTRFEDKNVQNLDSQQGKIVQRLTSPINTKDKISHLSNNKQNARFANNENLGHTLNAKTKASSHISPKTFYLCEFCKRRFRKMESLKKHWVDYQHYNMTVEPVTDELHICEVCNETFVGLEALEKHMNKNHIKLEKHAPVRSPTKRKHLVKKITPMKDTESTSPTLSKGGKNACIKMKGSLGIEITNSFGKGLSEVKSPLSVSSEKSQKCFSDSQINRSSPAKSPAKIPVDKHSPNKQCSTLTGQSLLVEQLALSPKDSQNTEKHVQDNTQTISNEDLYVCHICKKGLKTTQDYVEHRNTCFYSEVDKKSKEEKISNALRKRNKSKSSERSFDDGQRKKTRRMSAENVCANQPEKQAHSVFKRREETDQFEKSDPNYRVESEAICTQEIVQGHLPRSSHRSKERTMIKTHKDNAMALKSGRYEGADDEVEVNTDTAKDKTNNAVINNSDLFICRLCCIGVPTQEEYQRHREECFVSESTLSKVRNEVLMGSPKKESQPFYGKNEGNEILLKKVHICLKKVPLQTFTSEGEVYTFNGSLVRPVWQIKENSTFEEQNNIPEPNNFEPDVSNSPGEKLWSSFVNKMTTSTTSVEEILTKDNHESTSKKGIRIVEKQLLDGSLESSRVNNITSRNHGSGASTPVQPVEQVTEFERALLSKDECMKRKKPKHVKTHDRKRTWSAQPEKGEAVKQHHKISRLGVHEAEKASTTEIKPSHFHRSKMAQKIFKEDQEKRQKMAKMYELDGLPDFSQNTSKPEDLPEIWSTKFISKKETVQSLSQNTSQTSDFEHVNNGSSFESIDSDLRLDQKSVLSEKSTSSCERFTSNSYAGGSKTQTVLNNVQVTSLKGLKESMKSLGFRSSTTKTGKPNLSLKNVSSFKGGSVFSSEFSNKGAEPTQIINQQDRVPVPNIHGFSKTFSSGFEPSTFQDKPAVTVDDSYDFFLLGSEAANFEKPPGTSSRDNHRVSMFDETGTDPLDLPIDEPHDNDATVKSTAGSGLPYNSNYDMMIEEVLKEARHASSFGETESFEDPANLAEDILNEEGQCEAAAEDDKQGEVEASMEDYNVKIGEEMVGASEELNNNFIEKSIEGDSSESSYSKNSPIRSHSQGTDAETGDLISSKAEHKNGMKVDDSISRHVLLTHKEDPLDDQHEGRSIDRPHNSVCTTMGVHQDKCVDPGDDDVHSSIENNPLKENKEEKEVNVEMEAGKSDISNQSSASYQHNDSECESETSEQEKCGDSESDFKDCQQDKLESGSEQSEVNKDDSESEFDSDNERDSNQDMATKNVGSDHENMDFDSNKSDSEESGFGTQNGAASMKTKPQDEEEDGGGDVLDLFASDDASFLDEPIYEDERPRSTSVESESLATRVSREKSPEVDNTSMQDMDIDSLDGATLATEDNPSRARAPQDISQPSAASRIPDHPPSDPSPILSGQPSIFPDHPSSDLAPILSGPPSWRSRWMPHGYCFKACNNKPCQETCRFRHQEPSMSVLLSPSVIGVLSQYCHGGELDMAINMLDSHPVLQHHISQNDVLGLYQNCLRNDRSDLLLRLQPLLWKHKIATQLQIKEARKPLLPLPSPTDYGPKFINNSGNFTRLPFPYQGQVNMQPRAISPDFSDFTARGNNFGGISGMGDNSLDTAERGHNHDNSITRQILLEKPSTVQAIRGAGLVRNWNYLADLYLEHCSKQCPLDNRMLHEFVLCLTQDQMSVGQAWEHFLTNMVKVKEQKSKEDPNLPFDQQGLVYIGRELFLHCSQNHSWQHMCSVVELSLRNRCSFLAETQSPDTCSYIVQTLNACLTTRNPKLAAQLIIETPIKDLAVPERMMVMSQFSGIVQQLCQYECDAGAFDVLRTAFSLTYQSGRPVIDPNSLEFNVYEAASHIVVCCLKKTNVDLAIKVYKLFKDSHLQFNINDESKRSFLNALCMKKQQSLAREIFEQMKETILFQSQSFSSPRRIVLHRTLTLQEIVLVVEDYIMGLYQMFLDFVRENQRLSPVHLHLSIAFNQNTRFRPGNSELPYIPREPVQLQVVQNALQRPNIMNPPLVGLVNDDHIAIEPQSLERYLHVLDEHGVKQNLDFHLSDKPVRQGRMAARRGARGGVKSRLSQR